MNNKQSLKINKHFFNKAEIARKLGISRPYVHMLITGQRSNPEMIAKIKALIKQELKAA